MACRKRGIEELPVCVHQALLDQVFDSFKTRKALASFENVIVTSQPMKLLHQQMRKSKNVSRRKNYEDNKQRPLILKMLLLSFFSIATSSLFSFFFVSARRSIIRTANFGARLVYKRGYSITPVKDLVHAYVQYSITSLASSLEKPQEL